MMFFPLVFTVLILVPGGILGKYVSFRNDLAYDDLVQTNVTCSYSETCQEDKADPFQDRTCNCNSNCSEFGTCCIDSPYRDNSVPVVECRNVALTFSETGYFLVSSCPPEVGVESPWKDLCEKEWNGEEDMMKLAPVSSLDTFVTYKNYYCFRCHEDSDKFRNWDLRITSYSVDKEIVSEDFSMTYDKERKSWIATTGDGYVIEDIHFVFFAPVELSVEPEVCRFVLVSDCDDAWTDEGTREKCGAYTAIVYSKYNDSVSFRNPHCAMCNFVPVEDIECGLKAFGAALGPKEVFSFAHLLNIHRDDTDKSETKKCEENQLWDPYGRKCRRIACAIPGYVIKEGRCTRP